MSRSNSQRTSMLETMVTIRTYEERLAALATATQPGSCTSVGQEAGAVGVVRALEPRDRILTNHRNAGHLIARGAEIDRLFAEVLGRATGYCKGKSGSLHISIHELGVVLTSTIVGGELSLAPGVALAQKMRTPETDPGGLTCVFFGDGAACEGIFHESMNLASLWRLPVLYVCENNQWQALVHRREAMPHEHVRDWADAHAMTARTVDGNDADAVHAAALEATAAVRGSGRPYFLELVTYRQRGHFEPDDQHYVDPVEHAAWMKRDPIALYTQRLLDENVIGEHQLTRLRERVAATVAEALASAQASPWPAAGELTADVYA